MSQQVEVKIPFANLQKDFDFVAIKCTELPDFQAAGAQRIPERLFLRVDKPFIILDTVVINNNEQGRTDLENCDVNGIAVGSLFNNLSLYIPDHPFLSASDNIGLSMFITGANTYIVPDFRPNDDKLPNGIDNYEQYVFLLKSLKYGQ